MEILLIIIVVICIAHYMDKRNEDDSKTVNIKKQNFYNMDQILKQNDNKSEKVITESALLQFNDLSNSNININEIMFLDYMDGLHEDFFRPVYWMYDYNINYDQEINKLIILKYLKLEININKNLSNLKVNELKSLLKENAQETNGKKQTLIQRIIENIDKSYLEEKFNEKIYTVTNTGKKLIQENYLYIINRKKKYEFTDEEIQEAYKLKGNFSDSDRVWSILNKRNIALSAKGLWGLYSNNLYKMGYILFKEKKYRQALDFYIANFIIDLSGMANNNLVLKASLLFISSGLPEQIEELLELCNLSDADLLALINHNPFCKTLPFRYYDNVTLVQILIDCFNEIDFDYKNYPRKRPSKNNPNYTFF